MLERELSKISTNFYKVIIDGLYHTDDKICLKTIVNQLKVQIDGENLQGGSFADKLNLILSTLNQGFVIVLYR